MNQLEFLLGLTRWDFLARLTWGKLRRAFVAGVERDAVASIDAVLDVIRRSRSVRRSMLMLELLHGLPERIAHRSSALKAMVALAPDRLMSDKIFRFRLVLSRCFKEIGLPSLHGPEKALENTMYYSLPLTLDGVGEEAIAELVDWVDYNWRAGQLANVDIGDIVRLLERVAAAGDLKAKWLLAMCYLEGYGTDQDIERGLTLFREAAEEGSGQAQFTLGVFSVLGYRVPKDPHLGMSLIKAADDRPKQACICFEPQEHR